MKLRLALAGVVLAVALGVVGREVYSQQKEQKPAVGGSMSPEMQEQMAVWMKYAAPGGPHRELAERVGTWDALVRSWCGGPDAPATESKGVSEVKPILDGRYVMERFKCDMAMGDQTMGFEGIGITGYDNYKNMYSSFWVDNMGTQMMFLLGTRAPGSNKITYYGQADEPTLGVQDRMLKAVTTILSPDKHMFEMYDLHAGDDHKVMEITYTRRR